MSWLSRLTGVVRSGRLNRDLDDEMRFHMDERTEEYTKAGLPIEEARARARRQFGNAALLRDASRDVKLLPRLESMLRDASFATRLWRRNKLVTAAALVSLSLALGACTAAFSLIDALILRTLPVDDPESLVYVGLRAPGANRDGLSFNYPLFREMRTASSRQVQLFALSDQRRQDALFDDSRHAEKVYGQWVSGDTFAILGVKAALGRVLTSADDINPGQHPVAVLSYDFWTRRFARSPEVLGRWVTIREKPLQIVGVAASGFTGVAPGVMTDIWAPTMMWGDRMIADPGTRWFGIWGRMQPGVADEQARTVLQTIFSRFVSEEVAGRSAESPERNHQLLNTRVNLRPAATGQSWLREDFARTLWILAAIAGLVLLVACTNVASLLVARARARHREMALRASIGAGRGRLIQQVLIESGLMALAACALGAGLSAVVTPKIVSMISTSSTTVRLDVWPDWRVLAFLGGLGLLVTFLFGLAPALQASRARTADALKSAGRHATQIGVFRPLVAAQIAFSFVVLFVGGLCLSSFGKLLRTDLGFDANDLTLVSVRTSATGEDQRPAPASWAALLERLEQTPGIASASLSPWGLFAGSGRNKSVQIPGQPVGAYTPWYLEVSPGFLRTMKIPLVAGRDLEWRDVRQPGSPLAVIVNESFASRYFPGEPAIGKRFFRIDGGSTLVAEEVVGVAKDAKYTDLREPAPPTVYEPFWPQNAAVVQVRTQLEMGALLAVLREEVPRAHATFRLGDVIPQGALVDNHLVRDRALALLSAFFALVAGVLVIVGVYGLLSYTVLQRTREIGIRLALGAQPAQIVGLILRELGGMTVAGLVLGGVGAVYGGRFTTALLYEVTPSDLSSIAIPLAALLAACALAAVIPAHRATRIAPTTALTVE